MYNIGDKIVYPMHGAGVIEAIEDKEILGKKQKYYIMKMPVGGIQVMIPTSNAEEIGIRNIIKQDETSGVMETLDKKVSPESVATTVNWNKRYKENMEKMKTGNIYEVADVVKTLAYRDKSKGLSTGEKKMFNNAKQILISELVLANEDKMESSDVEDMIKEKLDNVSKYLN